MGKKFLEDQEQCNEEEASLFLEDRSAVYVVYIGMHARLRGCSPLKSTKRKCMTTL